MKETVSKKQLREFGLVIGFGIPFFIGWLLPSITAHDFRMWTLWLGCSGLVLGLTSPRYLYYPYKFWMSLAHILGWVNTKIILGLVFIFVLQPIAYVMRIFGYDPLRRKYNNASSYRENRLNYKIGLTRIF